MAFQNVSIGVKIRFLAWCRNKNSKDKLKKNLIENTFFLRIKLEDFKTLKKEKKINCLHRN